MKYWNFYEEKSKVEAYNSTDTFEVLKLGSSPTPPTNYFIQPIHLKYWNLRKRIQECKETLIQPIHLKYWNKFIYIFPISKGYIQPIHLKYWNQQVCLFYQKAQILHSTDTFEVLKFFTNRFKSNFWTNSTDTFEVLKFFAPYFILSLVFYSTDTFEVLK